ncbi:Guanylylate cyclase [Gracilaria domingensis]|nr:Guanylylate cyclase [Gracilaria domingensis]
MHDSRDTTRVLERFDNAETLGVTVIEDKVNIADIQRAVGQRQLVLVLVDKRFLRCTLCNGKQSSLENLRSGQRSSDGFLGHFVLLYAYHEESGYFLMKDPASGREHCVVSASNLDDSRLAFGTDEDIIFIGKATVPRQTGTPASTPQFSTIKKPIMQRELSRNEITAGSHTSTLEVERPRLRSDSSPSSTVGRDIFNFVLRKVFGVSIPRTK